MRFLSVCVSQLLNKKRPLPYPSFLYYSGFKPFLHSSNSVSRVIGVVTLNFGLAGEPRKKYGVARLW